MQKVSNQVSIEIYGGHNVVAYPTGDGVAASKQGVAGWQRYCPKTKHTTIHIFDGYAYDYRQGGTGRRYVCPYKKCK